MSDTDNPSIHLADGREVPTSAVEALNALDKLWPGATLEQARPAIVAAVLAAVRSEITGYLVINRHNEYFTGIEYFEASRREHAVEYADQMSDWPGARTMYEVGREVSE